ncbi:hypothetical protein C7Y69_18440 [Alteromonas sp. KS69]|uniref:Pycsar system effector family protein n=1 Tax=Alteromonas sp. KS69 TaxID=2109917 RepID=UPI000F89003E|nr:Pycsar system effector family protein [Alteromonas sp. KS69]RUP75761.1 hypothetical protein C7Y69_18440 [Alteromonas sp. KS69]
METEAAYEALLVDKLEKTQTTVNEWLKYSDQKLAGLTVLNVGVLWGYGRYTKQFQSISCLTEGLSFIGYFLIIISIFTCIVAMLPVLTKLWLYNENKSDSDNALFFADIQKYRAHEYLSLICKKLEIETTTHSSYVKDLASQIVTNAKITTVKFQRIKFASWFTLTGCSGLVASFLFNYFQG